MEPPKPSGDRLCIVHGHSLPPGEQPIAGREVELAGAVRAIDAGAVVGLANGLEREPLTPQRYRQGRERTARGLAAAREQALPALVGQER
jgi:hypothetical protein